MQEIERDPLFKMHDIHDISKEELRERTMEKVKQKIHLQWDAHLHSSSLSF